MESEESSELQEDVLKGEFDIDDISGDELISSSTKITALMDHVQELINNNNDKCLIVSQWTRGI